MQICGLIECLKETCLTIRRKKSLLSWFFSSTTKCIINTRAILCWLAVMKGALMQHDVGALAAWLFFLSFCLKSFCSSIFVQSTPLNLLNPAFCALHTEARPKVTRQQRHSGRVRNERRRWNNLQINEWSSAQRSLTWTRKWPKPKWVQPDIPPKKGRKFQQRHRASWRHPNRSKKKNGFCLRFSILVKWLSVRGKKALKRDRVTLKQHACGCKWMTYVYSYCRWRCKLSLGRRRVFKLQSTMLHCTKTALRRVIFHTTLESKNPISFSAKFWGRTRQRKKKWAYVHACVRACVHACVVNKQRFFFSLSLHLKIAFVRAEGERGQLFHGTRSSTDTQAPTTNGGDEDLVAGVKT